MEKTRKKNWRERLYEIIAKDRGQDRLSRLYDWYILILVFLSGVPLVVKIWTREIVTLDRIVTSLFIVDYLLRWITADFEPRLRGRSFAQAMMCYPVTPLAIVDLLSILPVLTTFSLVQNLDISLTNFLQVMRIMRVFRCVRFLKTMRYSKSCVYLYRAMTRERKLLGMVLMVAAMYIFVSAAVMFSVEPDTFGSFFDAVYWAAATLTTVGYGDIHPMTTIGRGVSMLSALFGIAVVAMPAGIITASFMEEVNRVRYRDERKLEEEVAMLLDEIRELRREQRDRGLEEKIERIADEVRRVHENRENDTVLLQDISEDLKNSLARGTISGKKSQHQKPEEQKNGSSQLS